MKNTIVLLLLLFCFTLAGYSQTDKVSVVKNSDGMKLVVNGEDFMINGMNWDYIPIGTNTVDANFWKNSDDVIRAGLDYEMSLLRNMNVNVIRQYTGVPARWIKYIYEEYGIYTMLNHSFGRYGLTLDGIWTPVTDYSDKKTQEFLISEVKNLVAEYKDTPGLLMYLLGNENNYGLFWAGAETEDFPDDEQEKQFVGEKRGRPMYRLMNEASRMIKSFDSSHPVGICNGDVLFIDIIAEECKDVDIYGTNVYRGVSFGDIFEVVKNKLDMPIMFTEFGADAFNAIELKEDQKPQAYYMVGNWKEIYENAAGLGKAGNSIGGFTFQFSDGWWKFGFDDRENADVHDLNASWANGGYSFDLAPNRNNMNEEWFGICAKGPTDQRGLYELYPRAAYYALKEAHELNPYSSGVTLETLQEHFDNIDLADAMLRARGDKAALDVENFSKIRFSRLEAKFTTFSTGGTLITTPDDPDPESTSFPTELGFDHMQSYFIGVEGQPTSNLRANVTVNILGNVANNPIDEIFYENRGRTTAINTEDGTIDLTNVNNVDIYDAEFEWDAKDFKLSGFYRTGHYHWGYEGDFFGLYPEANYGPNLDIYNGEISGVEFEGKGAINGLKAAFGPQLWWGANPAFLISYGRSFGHYEVTGIYHQDIDEAPSAQTSLFIPLPKTRRVSLHVKRELGRFGFELGGLWAGDPLNGRKFQFTEENPSYDPDNPEDFPKYVIYVDEVNSGDNWGGKAKVTYEGSTFQWYAQGGAQGIVANGGADLTRTITGWRLKDSGSGNQAYFLTGFAVAVDNWTIAPNFLWRKPIVGPIPNDVQPPGRLRNIQDDPFAVRTGSRETVGGELLFTFDPTPATWMYEWNNDRKEDAPFAMSAGFVFRHHPTSMDAAIGFLDDRTSFAFPNSVPAEDLWETNVRMVSKASQDLGLVANVFAGNGQARGDDPRVIERFGGDIRLIYKNLKFIHEFKFNDWGPYDYHRDFNLTFPVQLMLDVSMSLGKPDWFILPNTMIGIRGTWRTLDQYSNRYLPTTTGEFSNEPIISPVGFPDGTEWEIRTYVHINIGK